MRAFAGLIVGWLGALAIEFTRDGSGDFASEIGGGGGGERVGERRAVGFKYDDREDLDEVDIACSLCHAYTRRHYLANLTHKSTAFQRQTRNFGWQSMPALWFLKMGSITFSRTLFALKNLATTNQEQKSNHKKSNNQISACRRFEVLESKWYVQRSF